ncbi:YdcF family protein [Phytoactinopolyspora limicola]|uniref:YdcF family protein n=1 Tax=Phytoactinopolyspora limicola TaxID=2715536 RepID=UPI00140CCD30|nr:YdcF family protein [Phytoactinopolyspora limicola]
MLPTYVSFAAGITLMMAGIVAFVRERRRLRNTVFFLVGFGLAALSGLIIFDANGWFGAAPMMLVAGTVVILLLGYPVLMIFLIANGVMMWRRESRSLGNLLSLALGLAMLIVPPFLIRLGGWFDQGESGAAVWVAIVFFLMSFTAYVGFCFLAFLLAAIAYRRVPKRFRPRYVVVLGSGLIGGRVPPLLAARLDKAIEVAASQPSRPVIIPSGGRGADEDVAEGVAMAAYLRNHGVPDDTIRIEDNARNTRENLLYSRDLMDDPDAATVVVTTGYHVFRTAMLTRSVGLNARVRGARTAAYYVPSAFLREFVAVMREHVRLNVFLVGCLALFTGALLVVAV